MATPVSHITKEEKAFQSGVDKNRVEYGYWIITLERSGNSWYFEVGNEQDGLLDRGICKSRSGAVKSAKECADMAALYPRREW